MAFGDFSNDQPPSWTQLWDLFQVGLAFHILRSIGRSTGLFVLSSVDSIWTFFAVRSAIEREERTAARKDAATNPTRNLNQFRRSTRATPADVGPHFLGRGYNLAFNTHKAALRIHGNHRVLFATLSSFLNIVALALYWVSAARKQVTPTVGILQFALGLWFFIESVTSFGPDQGQRTIVEYFFDPGVFFESWAIPSMLASGIGLVSYINLNYLRLFTLYRSVAKVFYPSGNNPLNLHPNQVGAFTPYLILLVINLLAVIFTCALTIYSFEHLGEVVPSTAVIVNEQGYIWNIVTANYFILVTGTTVGYGDLLPQNGLSRLFVTVIIATVVFYVGGKLATVIKLMALSKLGDGEYQGNPDVNPHIVVTGQIEYSGLDALINAYFSDPANDRSRIVLLMPKLRFTISEYYSLLSGEGRAQRVHFIRGSPFDGHDRHRANCRNARAVLIISARETDDAIGSDSLNILSVSAIRDKLPTVPILSMHILSESSHNIEQAIFSSSDKAALKKLAESSLIDFLDRRSAKSSRISHREKIRRKFNVDSLLDIFHRKKLEHVVLDRMGVPTRMNAPNFNQAKGESLCLRDFHVALISVNIHCPGASTLISNALFELDLETHPDDQPWSYEYKQGASNGFYIWDLPPETEGIAFAELATFLFQTTGALLISLVDGGVQQESDIAAWESFGTKCSKAIVLASSELTNNSATLVANLTEVLRDRRREIDLSTVIQSENGPAVLQLRAKRRTFSMDDCLLNLGATQSEKSNHIAPEDLTTLENHIVICCFDCSVFSEVELLVRQLSRSPWDMDESQKPTSIVYLGPEVSEACVTKLQRRVPEFFAVVGDPEVFDDLLAVNVPGARTVIVMPEARCSLESEDGNDSFAVQDFETADSRTMYTALNLDLVLGDQSTTQIVLYLKDIRSVSFCPRPRSRMLGVRLGEPGRSLEQADLGPAGTLFRRVESVVTQASVADLVVGRDEPTGRFEEGAFGGTDLTQFRSVDDTTSFSRMRYASGQIVIPSVAPTLLVREHQIPGILGLVRALLGYNTDKPPMIRQFSVPRSFNGEAYSVLFTKIVSLNGLPIGLYRSGRAKVIYDPFEGHTSSPEAAPRFGLRSLSSGMDRRDVFRDRQRRSSSTDARGKRPRNTLPWVFTNPPPNTLLSFADGVYVVARDFGALNKYFSTTEGVTSYEAD